MPMIQRAFTDIFGARLEDSALYGLDPLAAVALGLAQHQALESRDFGYPNWAISADLSTPRDRVAVDLYTPFGPIFRLSTSGSTFVYTAEVPTPKDASACQLNFRRVAPGEGIAWPEVALPPGTHAIRLELSLLGDVGLYACVGTTHQRLAGDHEAAPWKSGEARHPDWLPKPTAVAASLPDWDWPNDGPG